MRHTRYLPLALVVACAGGAKHVENQATDLDNRAKDEAAFRDSLLEHVDADAILVYASLDPMPEALLERGMNAFREAAAPIYELVDLAGEEAFESGEERTLYVVSASLRDKLSVAGLRSIGIDLARPFIVHSVGLMPVLRVGSNDPEAFRRFLEDTAAAAHIELAQKQVGTREYWAFRLNDMFLVAVTVDRTGLIVAVAPAQSPEPTLERAFGVVAPKRSMADERVLDQIRERYDITTNRVGFIDLARLWAYFGPAAAPFDREQFQALVPGAAQDIPPACARDGDRLVAHMPRLVMGYRQFDTTQSRGVSALETSPELGRALMAVVHPQPWLKSQPSGQPLVQFSVGIDYGALISSLRALSERRWQCAPLDEASQGLAQAIGELDSVPFGAMVTGLLGVHLVIDDLLPRADGTAEIRGHAIVEHRAPAALLDPMIAMLGLPAVRDGALPAQMSIPLPFGTQTLSVGRSGTSLIFALGPDGYSRATALLGAESASAGPVMTFAYHEARLYSLAEKLPWLYELLDDDRNREVDDQEELERFRRVDAALASGFTYAALWFRERAIVIESVVLHREP